MQAEPPSCYPVNFYSFEHDRYSCDPCHSPVINITAGIMMASFLLSTVLASLLVHGSKTVGFRLRLQSSPLMLASYRTMSLWWCPGSSSPLSPSSWTSSMSSRPSSPSPTPTLSAASSPGSSSLTSSVWSGLSRQRLRTKRMPRVPTLRKCVSRFFTLLLQPARRIVHWYTSALDELKSPGVTQNPKRAKPLKVLNSSLIANYSGMCYRVFSCYCGYLFFAT